MKPKVILSDSKKKPHQGWGMGRLARVEKGRGVFTVSIDAKTLFVREISVNSLFFVVNG